MNDHRASVITSYWDSFRDPAGETQKASYPKSKTLRHKRLSYFISFSSFNFEDPLTLSVFPNDLE